MACSEKHPGIQHAIITIQKTNYPLYFWTKWEVWKCVWRCDFVSTFLNLDWVGVIYFCQYSVLCIVSLPVLLCCHELIYSEAEICPSGLLCKHTQTHRFVFLLCLSFMLPSPDLIKAPTLYDTHTTALRRLSTYIKLKATKRMQSFVPFVPCASANR